MGCSFGTIDKNKYIIKIFKIKFITYEKYDVLDYVSRMDALQSIETYCQSVVGVGEVAHMKYKDFATVLPGALKISRPL